MKRGALPMRNTDNILDTVDNSYYNRANHIAIACVVAFGIFRIATALQVGRIREGILAGVGCIAVFFTIIILRALRRIINPALSIPLFFYIIYIVASILMDSFIFFAPICFAICCIGAMYFNPKKFLQYILITNISNLLLIFLGFPMKNPLRNVTFNEMMTNWFLLLFGSICIYYLTKFATDYSRESVKDQDAFQTLLETTPDYIALVDELNCITHISKPLAEMAHIENRRLAVGTPIMDIFSPRKLKMLIYDIISSQGFYESTFEITIDAQKRHFKIVADKLIGNTAGLFFNADDITSLVKAKLDAERAAIAKTAFLANTSHEIRTPMNAILGMTELILRKNVAPDVYEDARSIKQAGSNLLSIINDILDFSKIESGRLEIIEASYQLSSVINDVISIIRMRIAEKPILFTVDIDSRLPSRLIGDEVRVRQILMNLLSNAAKYTREGRIILTITGEPQKDKIILNITVTDTGIGIKKDDIGKLFSEFQQLDPQNNQGIEGTGLGLAISRNLCRLMGGDITVSSEYRRGSVFSARVPQGIMDNAPIAAVKNPQSRAVLLYEKREEYAKSLIHSLENLNIPVTVAVSRENFALELQEDKYIFAFMCADMLEIAQELVNVFVLPVKLVLLADLGEISSFKNIPIISMPGYTLSIANVINEKIEDTYRKKSGVRFTAPDVRILIVDDIVTNLNVARGLLALYRTNITTSTSGREAIDLVKHNHYDLIFMDHMMPDMDGIETTAIIRSMEGEYFRSVPIIALTANAMAGMKEMFLEKGFNDFLSKPIEILKLDGMMSKWILPEKQVKAEPGASLERGQEATNIHIDGVDTAKGIAMTGGSEAGYRKVLHSFFRDALERLPMLESSPGIRELPSFTAQVHALKSAAATIGAVGISKDAAELEAAGKTGDPGAIGDRLGDFYRNLKNLAERIGWVLNTAEAAETKNAAMTDLSSFLPQLKELRDALEKKDIDTIDRGIGELENKPFDKKTKEIFSSVSDAVLMTEFQKAVTMINELINTTGA
jgi:signal transduction histidine kinase/CheY-like chemotaxis protein